MEERYAVLRSSVLAILVCSMATASVNAQTELQGANAVFEFLTESMKKAEASDKEAGAQQEGSMKEQIKLLQKKWDVYFDKRSDLSAEASVTDWLEIFDIYTATSQNAKRMDWSVWKREPGKTYTVMGDLPDTSAWPQWLDDLQKRSGKFKEKSPDLEAYTLFLVEFLKGDKESAWKRWKEFSKMLRDKEIGDDEYQIRQLVSSLDYFEENIAEDLKIDEYKLTKFEQALKERENAEDVVSSNDPFGGRSLRVPKLAQLTTPDKTIALLKRVFALKFAENELYLDFDDETSRLAVSILISNPELIQKPYWSLIRGVDSLPLYEVYATKYRETVNTAREKEDYSWQNAVRWVIAAHLEKGEVDQAVDMAVQSSRKNSTEIWVRSRVTEQLLSLGKGAVLFNYYKALLDKIPTADVWGPMTGLGARINRSGEVRQLAEAMVAQQEKTNPNARNSALELLLSTALADDDVKKGVEYLREQVLLTQGEVDKLLKLPKSKQNKKWRTQLQDWGSELTNSAYQIKKIGEVTKQENIRKEGAAILSRWYTGRIENYKKDDYDFSTIIEYFIENDELVRAEKAIMERVKSGTEKVLEELKKENYPGSNPFNSQELSGIAELLIKVYNKADRSQDVVDMFRKWPFWGAFDISQLDARGDNLGFNLVTALEKTGDKKTASKILKALLYKGQLTNNDDAYAMLLRLEGQNAMDTLDTLYARDAFEERPLIWKGSLLLKSGKLDEAEAVIRKAISIDPSDGEQGKGDRMRVYGVLADIFEAKGNHADAKLYREVLKAIRIAEDADDVYSAGLTSRGIKQYNEALTHFADAYCIQSRLASQLNDAGRFEEARVHYRRAFELMPDSFGRMESHCFGCEGVFSGKNAEGIAEQVFTNLIKEQPEKPQLYYLLGYLRSSQNRDKEALELFQKAVKLDPEYINAWKKIAGFRENPLLSLQQRDEASIALARLDPYSRHGGSSEGSIFDVKGMLAQLESVASKAPDAEGELFELTATKDYTEKLVETQLAEAGEEFANRGTSKEDLIKQMIHRGQAGSAQGSRSQIRQFLARHQVLASWQQYYQNILQAGR